MAEGPLGRLGAAKAAALAVLVALGLLGWLHLVAPTLARDPVTASGVPGWVTGDFVAFVVAGEAAVSATPASAYDRSRLAERLRGHGVARQEASAWSYPPPALLLVWPLAGADGPTTRRAWTIALTLAAAVAAAVAARDARAALLALPMPALQLALAQGQVTGLVALALAPTIAFADRRPFLAGLALGGLVFKPHLLIGPGLVMLGAGRWRLAAGAATGGVALAAAATLAFGWAPWPAFAAELARRTAEIGLDGVQATRMVTPFGFASRFVGPGVAALALHAAGAVLALALAIRIWRLDGEPAARALALVVAALAVPTLAFEYDLALLLLPVAAATGVALRGGVVPGWGDIAVGALGLSAGVIAFAVHHLCGVQPASLVLLAALALAWRRAEARRR